MADQEKGVGTSQGPCQGKGGGVRPPLGQGGGLHNSHGIVAVWQRPRGSGVTGEMMMMGLHNSHGIVAVWQRLRGSGVTGENARGR